MSDQEQKYRQRYVDLITDEDARKRFAARSKAVSSIRNFMVDHGFLEGRDAHVAPHPGRRECQALHHPPQRAGPADVLRIAPELYLKRLAVGGLSAVRDQPATSATKASPSATTPSSR